MSNSVSNFIFTNTPSEYTHSSYFIGAYNSDYRVHVMFDTLSFPTALCVREAIDGSKGVFIDLTKDQITHLLSLDCPDAFIAYALTLSPFSSEAPDLYQTLYNRNPDDFVESPIPDGYYVDTNNCLMLIPENAFFCEYCECAQIDDAVAGVCQCIGDW